MEEHLEELQHDLALIGQIAGLVASLRKSYDVSLIRKVPAAPKIFENFEHLKNWIDLNVSKTA